MSLRFTFDEYDDNNDFYFTPLKRTQPPADVREDYNDLLSLYSCFFIFIFFLY